MDAGLELLASEKGARTFTVRGVCREAELSSRYFYENFGDGGELAVAIYDAEVLDLTTITLAAMDGIHRRHPPGRTGRARGLDPPDRRRPATRPPALLPRTGGAAGHR